MTLHRFTMSDREAPTIDGRPILATAVNVHATAASLAEVTVTLNGYVTLDGDYVVLLDESTTEALKALGWIAPEAS